MKQKYLKMGWFGWTFTVVIAVALISSSLFFSNLFNLNDLSLFNDSDNQGTDADEVSEETAEKVEEVRGTVGKENQNIGQFVSDMHDFYNETTGYGGISSLDWNKQTKQADTILSALNDKIPDVDDDALTTDLKHIRELAEAVDAGDETGDVRSLHRMFHDLDIALNDYNTYDKIWNVTKTLDTTN